LTISTRVFPESEIHHLVLNGARWIMTAVAAPHTLTEQTATFAARTAGKLGSCGTAIEGSVFTVSPPRCAMCFLTAEADVNTLHER
jgi:hypothetical protein